MAISGFAKKFLKKNGINKRSNKQHKKSVSFTEVGNDDETTVNSDSLRSVTSVLEYDKYENSDDIWFTREEEATFKERDQRMIISLQTLTPMALEEHFGDSPRGLEHGSNFEESKSIASRRQRSLNCVLATQTLFQKQGRDGSESIARSYAMVCESAIQTAIERAAMDELTVMGDIEGDDSVQAYRRSGTSSNKENDDENESGTNDKKKQKWQIFGAGKRLSRWS